MQHINIKDNYDKCHDKNKPINYAKQSVDRKAPEDLNIHKV